jgi:hypothetical protein
MASTQESRGFVVTFLVFGALAFGATVVHASLRVIIPVIKGDPQHQIAVQEAKCEMEGDEIYRTADKDDVALPVFVNRCMTVAGYDFVGGVNAICSQNEMDSLKTGQTGQLGGYDMSTDPSCYVKYQAPPLFGS